MRARIKRESVIQRIIWKIDLEKLSRSIVKDIEHYPNEVLDRVLAMLYDNGRDKSLVQGKEYDKLIARQIEKICESSQTALRG